MAALTQRWLFGQHSWRLGDEPVRVRDFDVVRMPKDAEVKAFVERHHYTGTMTAARERFGLFHARSAQLVGVAVFGVPQRSETLDVLAGPGDAKLDLGRLVLLDEVPGNGESMFVAECFRQLRREGYVGVVSFSDPMPRARVDGTVVMPGHVGLVYQSLNSVLVGRSRARILWLLPDGTNLQDRAAAKVRALEQGWRYVVRGLVAHGAEPLEVVDEESPEERARAAAWLETWRAKLCRPVRHPGNWKYAWGLDRATTRLLPKSLPYPAPPGGRVPPKHGRRARQTASSGPLV